MNKIRIMQASVAKWQRIIDGRGSDGGVLDCPPCRLFYVLVCTGCPIAEFTGKKFCQRTPYGPWLRHQNDVHGKIKRKVYCPECLKHAQAMHSFMIEVVEDLKKKQKIKKKA